MIQLITILLFDKKEKKRRNMWNVYHVQCTYQLKNNCVYFSFSMKKH